MKAKVVCATPPDHAKAPEKGEPLLGQGRGIVSDLVGQGVEPRVDSQGLPVLSQEELRRLKDAGFEVVFAGERPDGENRRF